jgi:hypothetical protein
MLDNCLDSWELNFNAIPLIADDSPQQCLNLTDLSKEEKQLILSTPIISIVAIKILAGIFRCDFETAASRVAEIGELEFGWVSSKAVDGAVAEIAKKLKDNFDGGPFYIEVEH